MIKVPKEDKIYLLVKHGREGRPNLFDDPEQLLEAAIEFFKWCDANPIKVIDFKGAMITEVEYPKPQVYTYAGLGVYLGCARTWFKMFKDALNNGTDNRETKDEFLIVLGIIDNTIYTQKYTMGTIGVFNAAMVIRDLGLTEKVQTENTNIAINIDQDDVMLGRADDDDDE